MTRLGRATVAHRERLHVRGVSDLTPEGGGLESNRACSPTLQATDQERRRRRTLLRPALPTVREPGRGHVVTRFGPCRCVSSLVGFQERAPDNGTCAIKSHLLLEVDVGISMTDPIGCQA